MSTMSHLAGKRKMSKTMGEPVIVNRSEYAAMDSDGRMELTCVVRVVMPGLRAGVGGCARDDRSFGVVGVARLGCASLWSVICRSSTSRRCFLPGRASPTTRW